MGALLTEILESIAVRIEVRVAILTGAGDRAFSVGSDLRQRKAMTKQDWLRQRQDFDRTLYTVRQLRKPIFAAVNGAAYGGGSELAQSTDFIIASDNATFGQPEAMIGLAAGGGSPALLPRLLPPGRAMQMLLTGDPITAQEAHRLGMVNEIHPQATLMDAAQRIAEKIASNSPTAVQAVKWSARTGQGEPFEQAITIMMAGPLALRCPPRPGRRHRRLQRKPRTHLPGSRLLSHGNLQDHHVMTDTQPAEPQRRMTHLEWGYALTAANANSARSINLLATFWQPSVRSDARRRAHSCLMPAPPHDQRIGSARGRRGPRGRHRRHSSTPAGRRRSPCSRPTRSAAPTSTGGRRPCGPWPARPRLARDWTSWAVFGLEGPPPKPNLRAILANSDRVARHVFEKKHLADQLRRNGINLVEHLGPAHFTDPHTLIAGDGRALAAPIASSWPSEDMPADCPSPEANWP